MNLEKITNDLSSAADDAAKKQILADAGFRTEEEFNKAVRLTADGYAKTLAEMNKNLENLQKELVEFKRPDMFGEPDSKGIRDNGVAGTGGKKAVITKRPDYFDHGTNKMHHQVVYESVGDEQRELIKRFSESVKTRRPMTATGNVSAVTGKALSEGSNPAGGFTVFGESMSGILEQAYEDAPLFAEAMKIQLGSDSISAAQLVQTFGSTPSYFGVTWAWQGEASSVTESTNPSYQLRELRAKKMVGLHVISTELLEDSAGFMTHLTNLLGRAYGYEWDEQLWNGDGITEPYGILSAVGTQTVSRTTASRFKLLDVLNMDQALDEAFKDAKWWGRKATISNLYEDETVPYAGATAGMGQPRAQIMVGDLGGPLGRPSNLAGYPVVITKHAPALNTAGDVALFDPKSILVGMRRDMELSTSFDAYFTTDQMGVRITARGDAQPIFPAGIVLLSA